jgi:CheY-like chemotaxis protein
MIDGRKILCVEDAQEIIDLIKLICQSKGHEVVGALGGEAVPEIASKRSPTSSSWI